MIDVVKDRVVLPLEDPGKAETDTSTIAGRNRRSQWRGLWLAVPSLGLGLAAGVALQPSVTPIVFELAGLDPIQSSSVTVAGSAEIPLVAALDVVALGRLLPNDGTLAVALPNGAGDARIARLMVAEGDRVDAGQIIAELDNLPQLVATKMSAESTLAAQQAALAQVRASVAASLAEARANRISADAALVLANQELARLAKLAERKLTTQVLLQQAQSTAAKAAAELERTEALVERFSGAEAGRQPDIVLAACNVDLARANLARANEDLAAARVVAPRPGTVLEIYAHVGEKPSDTGVMKIGDIERMTAELEVYQTDIAKVALGQVAELTARALTAPLSGKVTKIGQMVGRQSVMSSEPAANADARVVRVTIALDASSSLRARSYTNLEVVGRIRTKVD